MVTHLAAAAAAALGIGLADGPGGAQKLRASAPFEYRYQYLAAGWQEWNPNGSFATRYVRESVKAHVTPVFTLYTIRQSPPGRDNGDEAAADLGNLRNKATMKAWYANARLLFKRLGAFKGKRVIVHVEPDLWGYVEQAAKGDRASSVPAVVGHGLPNNASGLARAVVRMRNRYAPNVRLAYHVSVWGTKTDIALQNPSMKRVTALGHRAARFYRSLHAHFDMSFGEFDDRDSGFNEIINGDGGASWWDAADFRRDVHFTSVYSRGAKQPIVKWQIPLGNSMLDNTWTHFRDNRVQWLLGEGAASRKHLRAYAKAGVVALLFGGGADGTTSADTDGGYFRSRVRAYYKAGPLRLR